MDRASEIKEKSALPKAKALSSTSVSGNKKQGEKISHESVQSQLSVKKCERDFQEVKEKLEAEIKQ